MKILVFGGNKFLRNMIALLPVQAIFATRKKARAVLFSERPDGVVINGFFGEINGAGVTERSAGNINFHRRIKNLPGRKTKILRCGYEDSDEKDFIRIPFSSSELLQKLGYYRRKKMKRRMFLSIAVLLLLLSGCCTPEPRAFVIFPFF